MILTDFLIIQTKIRHVFGQAFHYILIEGLSLQPLLQMFMSIDSPYFIGLDPRKAVPDLIERFVTYQGDMLSLDWSSFDQTVEHWEIEDVFNLLESILDFPNPESRSAFHFSKVFFINRKIASPDGNLYFKHRGVPSGSYFTNLVDTFVNYRRVQYLFHRLFNYILPSYMIKCLGDDSILNIPRSLHFNPYQFAPILAEYVSIWLLSIDKCSFGQGGDTVDFLQRTLWIGDQSRDRERVDRLAMFPEYPVTDKQISAYRARALWEDGNYTSNFLGFATQYLESTYGVIPEDQVPQIYKTWKEVINTF